MTIDLHTGSPVEVLLCLSCGLDGLAANRHVR